MWGLLYGELTVAVIWLVLLVAAFRGRRDPVGVLVLASAPVVLALFEVVKEVVFEATRYSAGFSRLRIPFFEVPLVVLLGGAVYVYCLRELGRGLVRGTTGLRAVSWLPVEFRYLFFLGLLATTGWVVEWMSARLGLWQWQPALAWDLDVLVPIYRYYLLCIFSSILYAGALAWLVGARTGSRR